MTTARGYSISMTPIMMIVTLYGMIPIGNVIRLHNKPAKNQPASPAIAAVPGPAPKRGRMVAYNHTRTMPVTKSRNMYHGISAARHASVIGGSFCIATDIGAFTRTPYSTTSTMLRTTPATRPPIITFSTLIFPIVTLHQLRDDYIGRDSTAAGAGAESVCGHRS